MGLSVKKKRFQMDATFQWLYDNLPKVKDPVVLAVDLSWTATGFCVIQSGGIIASGDFGTNSEFGTARERNAYMYKKFAELIAKYEPDIAGFEAITVWKNPAATHKLIYTEAEFYHALNEVDPKMPLFKLITSQIKKVASGDSTVNKSQVLKEVLLNYGVNMETDNQADAYCVGVALSHLREIVDHYIEERGNADDRDKFLLDFDNDRMYSNEISCNQWIYEVLLGMIKGESGNVLKTNDKQYYHQTLNQMKGV